MRILLGLGRGLAFLYLLWGAAAAIGCDQLPAGQVMWVRLATPISTYTAQVGDPVRAILTQDVTCGSDVVVPMGTQIYGVVRSKRKVGWGIRHETAALELEFNGAVYEDGSTITLSARVEEIENAREQVKRGVIQGVVSSDTFQGRINSRLIHLPTWNPYSDLGLIIYKATFPIFPEPEIYYPTGTDIRLKTTSALSSLPMVGKDVPDAIPADTSQLDAWVQQIPQRTTTKKSVSADLLNLVFVGSREQVQAAFHEAGWHNSDPVSRHSFERNFYALLNNSGYAQQPMSTLLLDGKPEDMNWQKGLNSYGRRDHLRIWEWTPEGANEAVWLSSSTHDTGAVLSVKYKGFVHHIAPAIDEERAKVVRDLNFAGCVKSVTYVSRSGLSMTTQNATGDVMFTDGSIAVIQLQDCQPISPELAGNLTASNFKPGNHAFRYMRREILTFRNDIWRANIIYGIYDVGRMTFNALRRQPTVVPPASIQTVVPMVARSTPVEVGN
jgi:hypothetical protein